MIPVTDVFSPKRLLREAPSYEDVRGGYAVRLLLDLIRVMHSIIDGYFHQSRGPLSANLRHTEPIPELSEAGNRISGSANEFSDGVSLLLLQ